MRCSSCSGSVSGTSGFSDFQFCVICPVARSVRLIPIDHFSFPFAFSQKLWGWIHLRIHPSTQNHIRSISLSNLEKGYRKGSGNGAENISGAVKERPHKDVRMVLIPDHFRSHSKADFIPLHDIPRSFLLEQLRPDMGPGISSN